MDTLHHLRLLHEALSHPRSLARPKSYSIPRQWLPQGHPSPGLLRDPFALYASIAGAIINADPLPLCGGGIPRGGWCRDAVVYNMLIRLTCAYDHDGDGTLGRDRVMAIIAALTASVGINGAVLLCFDSTSPAQWLLPTPAVLERLAHCETQRSRDSQDHCKQQVAAARPAPTSPDLQLAGR